MAVFPSAEPRRTSLDAQESPRRRCLRSWGRAGSMPHGQPTRPARTPARTCDLRHLQPARMRTTDGVLHLRPPYGRALYIWCERRSAPHGGRRQNGGPQAGWGLAAINTAVTYDWLQRRQGSTQIGLGAWRRGWVFGGAAHVSPHVPMQRGHLGPASSGFGGLPSSLATRRAGQSPAPRPGNPRRCALAVAARAPVAGCVDKNSSHAGSCCFSSRSRNDGMPAGSTDARRISA